MSFKFFFRKAMVISDWSTHFLKTITSMSAEKIVQELILRVTKWTQRRQSINQSQQPVLFLFVFEGDQD